MTVRTRDIRPDDLPALLAMNNAAVPNLEPPNPGSLAFHHRLGFAEVGQQATKGGSVVVSLLALPV